MKPSALRAVILPLLGGTMLSGCAALYDHLGGPYRGAPADAFAPEPVGLSLPAQKLLDDAFDGFANVLLRDYHVHYFGNKARGRFEGCAGLNAIADPQDRWPQTNFKRLRAHQAWYEGPFVEGVYLDALDVDSQEKMDEAYQQRLVDLVSGYGPYSAWGNPELMARYRTQFYLMAMDGIYGSDGRLDRDCSFNYVSNEFITTVAECLNERLATAGGFVGNRFIAVGSINPLRVVGECPFDVRKTDTAYEMRAREDLMREIRLLHEHGVRWIKWRPPSMAIDPEVVAPWFYEELKAHGIGILTHTGDSSAIDLSSDINSYASPDKMKTALANGTDVVMLHIGRVGKDAEEVPFWKRFFCAIESQCEQDRAGTLRGEISAVPYGDTHGLLKQVAEHSSGGGVLRFLNGSDYPAVTPYLFVRYKTLNLLVRPERGGPLPNGAWLSPEQRKSLDEIFRFNPLLFDFVLKRTLVHNGVDIPREVFIGEI
jgi:mannonate dehydratase